MPLLYFLLGACFGSFLYASVYRLKKKIPVFKLSNRSMCPNCKHELGLLDLIPIFSFLFLRGKCRYCHQRISYEYFLVEVITGIIFTLTGISIQNGINFNYVYSLYGRDFIGAMTNVLIIYIYSFSVASIFMFFSLYDYKYRIIPNRVIILLITLYIYIFLIMILFSSFSSPYSVWAATALNHLLSGIIAGIFFFLIILITKGKGMGGGDLKLAILMGLVLGFPGIVEALYVAFLVGAIFAISLLILKRKNMKESIPFGPFLSLGTILFFIYGDILLKVIY